MSNELSSEAESMAIQTIIDSRSCQTPSPPRVSLLCLPASVHEKILQGLDEHSLKNISLTCYQFLSSVELIFEYAPKLHVSDRSNQVTDTVRIIAESKDGHLFESPIDPLRPVPVLYKTYRLQIFQTKPPTYLQSYTQTQPDDYRRQRQLGLNEEKLWLCPHVGCTLDDLNRLRYVGCLSTRDTVLAACTFPKCALWARHAVVKTFADWQKVFELCSVIKAYRIRYSDDKSRDIRQNLTTMSREKLQRAFQHLRMPICRHLELGSKAVTDVFDPEQLPIFATDPHEGRRYYPHFSPNVDEGTCEHCSLEGTYTIWGFWARLTKSELSTDGASWIDIEMTLIRPFQSRFKTWTDYVDWIADPHWRAHCPPQDERVDFVDGWWRWAERVADEGFDWRARLPARFLQTNRSALINFPQLSAYAPQTNESALINTPQVPAYAPQTNKSALINTPQIPARSPQTTRPAPVNFPQLPPSYSESNAEYKVRKRGRRRWRWWRWWQN